MTVNDIADFLLELCEISARETLPRFRSTQAVHDKGEGKFDPVTEADKAAEAAIRAAITARFPDHGIIGEEYGSHAPQSAYCWIIDPIDGTRAFISGLPSWGTLIGLTRDGRPVAGVMDQPFIGETYLGANGASSWYHRKERKTLTTSGTDDLGSATVMTTSPFLFAEDRIGRYRELEGRCRLSRYGFDCYAYAMLAAGHIDLVVESGLKAFDIAALIPIIEQAGGVVTTWQGLDAANGGDILAAANPSLHAQALDVLKI